MRNKNLRKNNLLDLSKKFMKFSQDIINKDIENIIDQTKNEINILSGKTILITGSNGFLGSYIVDTIKYLNDNNILKLPCKVIGLNRSEITSSSKNFHALEDKNFRFIKHDASIPLKVDFKIDYIFHSAGSSSPAVFQKYPLNTIDVNVNGTRWLLELAKKQKIKSMIFLSSGEIYGNPSASNIPTPETYNGNSSPFDRRACYIESKRLAETLCDIYHKSFDVPIKVARPFVIYGPGVKTTDGKVLSDFMKYALEKKPIEMLSEGNDLRSDCYISDATVAFLKILLSDKNGEVYNVGSDKEEFTIRELAEMIHAICKIDKAPIYNGAPIPPHLQSAPKRFFADISKIKKDLDFSPKIDLQTGLKNTIEWNKLIIKETTRR